MIRGILLLCWATGILIQGHSASEICVSSDHAQVVVGSPFSISSNVVDEGSGDVFDIQGNCSFWTRVDATEGAGTEQVAAEDWAIVDMDYLVYAPGDYQLNCGSDETQDLSVTSAEYVFSLCENCDHRRSHFFVTTGVSIRWVLLPARGSREAECAMSLEDEEGAMTTFPAGTTTHTFETAGTYFLSCQERNTNISATVVVTDGENVPWGVKRHLRPLLYTHVALMAAAFAVLFPLAAFTHYHGLTLAYKVLLPLGMLLALCGLVLVVVYAELTRQKHFHFFIHGAVGLALLFLCLIVMPLLLLYKKLRVFSYRAGHVVAFFGMGNVLLGLTIISIPLVVHITLSIIYALWLIMVVLLYTFYPAKGSRYTLGGSSSRDKKPAVDAISMEMTSRNGSLKMSRKSSCTSETSRGPQPLTKNLIAEDKMVQLRKKSMDFMEAQKHMRALNAELGLKHQLARDLQEDEDDEGFKLRMERKDSKATEQDFESSGFHLNDSTAPLHQSSPETDDPFTSPMTGGKRFSPDPPGFRAAKPSTSDEDEDADSFQEYLQQQQRSSSYQAVNRSCTFNYGSKVSRKPSEDKNYESDTSERGGSLRITRHSKRARGKIEHIFRQPVLDTVQSPTSPPSFNITPSSPPVNHAMLNYKPPDELELEESTDSIGNFGMPKVTSAPALMRPPPSQLPLSSSPTPAAAGGRRRRAGLAPVIPGPGGLEMGQQQGSGCPFHNPRTPSPKPCRRGVSPGSGVGGGAGGGGGGSGADEGASPRPVRKKKVSVAQIEATFAPTTPVCLEPPAHIGRSSSFSRIPNPQDTFADNAFRSVMQISQDAICCANSVGDIVFWSAGASKMFGYTPGEAIGSSLEMIIPQSYKEKHRNGIGKRAEDTLKYIRKHSYAPEEQKHARLYAVHGVTKGGHEFPVEVNVTSFVLDGEIFFTGVISELAKNNGRNNSISGSANDLNEIALKQRALAVGAQMKIAHSLRSAEHISQRELERVLKGSLGNNFTVDEFQMEQMITGIMKAGDPEDTGAISFVRLIQLLSKHQLYISESGLIARYGKTKSATNSDNSPSNHRNRCQQAVMKLKQFVHDQKCNFVWLLLYVALNLLLFAIGVGVYSRDEGKEGWRLWAFGTGPVLSMNCVLILLPTLASLVHAMRGSVWMNKIFPLKHPLLFHIAVAIGLLFWTGVHLLTHFCSFGLTYADFKTGVSENLFPTITGCIALVVVGVMGTSSIKPIRSLLRFIPFRFTHWVGSGLFYLLLLVHGVNYWNPSFWKWLLPAVIIFVLERLYRHGVIKKVRVGIKSAGRYDSVSRTAIVELDKPKNFEFEPGQYVLLNVPQIGKFEWQPCQISSGPKEERLTIHIPFSNDIWFKKAFEYLKQNPHNLPQPGQHQHNTRTPNREKNVRVSQVVEEDSPIQFPAHFTGPYGPTHSSKVLFKYKVSTVVCGGDGPHIAKAIIKKFLDYRKAVNCHCGCQPMLSKLYFVWVIPSGNDFEWFTDYLSDLCEDDHLHRYLDIRVFLTNCDSAPDELASALLQLGLKTAGDKVTVRRPSQPQLNNLYHMTSYGLPDFTSLLDYISAQHSSLWMDKPKEEFGVFTVGNLQLRMQKDLTQAIVKSSKPGQLTFKKHEITG